MSNAGDKLRELRLSRRMYQRELAEILGVADSTLAMWEQGRREMDNDTLIEVAKYFNVSVDYLLGRDTIPENIDVAFYGQLGDLSKEQKEDIIKYAEFIKQRDARK